MISLRSALVRNSIPVTGLLKRINENNIWKIHIIVNGIHTVAIKFISSFTVFYFDFKCIFLMLN